MFIDKRGLLHWKWLIIWMCLCAVFCIMIVIGLIWKLCIIQHKPPTMILRCIVIGIFSFSITAIAQPLQFLQMDKSGSLHESAYSLIMIFIILISWSIGQLSIYLLFISNLYQTFKDTPLRLSILSIIILNTSLILYCILRAAKIILMALGFAGLLGDYFGISTAITVFGSEVADLILSLYLIYSFVHRLKALRDINRQNMISYITRKYVILSTIVIVFTQLSLVSVAVDDYVQTPLSPESTTIPFVVCYVVESFGCFMCALCIYLQCNDELYRKLCCQPTRNRLLMNENENDTMIDRTRTDNLSSMLQK
eukprot:391939_1